MVYAGSSFHLASNSSSFSDFDTSSTGSSSRLIYPSGPDDLAISFDAWEACKELSSPDVVNRFQSMDKRDIKCANILVDASGVVKLADFGLAKVSRFNDIKSCKETPFWMAPELLHRKGRNGYESLADIWSLGCTVLEMLTRQIPYSHLEPNQAMFQIMKGKLPALTKTLYPDARDFILKCLKVKPRERPTAAELLNHPFVRRPFPSALALAHRLQE